MSERAELLARHVSPDGQLVWRVERETEAGGRIVISFGFERLGWHLHPEFFEANGRSPEQIASDVTADLIEDLLIVIISTLAGAVEYRILNDIEFEVDFKSSDENLVFRRWSGDVISIEEIIDGTTSYKSLGQQVTLP